MGSAASIDACHATHVILHGRYATVTQRQPSCRGHVIYKVGAASVPGSVVNDLALSRDCRAFNVEDALTPIG